MNLYSRFKKSIYWLILPKSKHHLINLLPELNIKNNPKDHTSKVIFFRRKEVMKTLPLGKLKQFFHENNTCFLVDDGPSTQHVYFKKEEQDFFIGVNKSIELSK